jgi:hypothetical protein
MTRLPDPDIAGASPQVRDALAAMPDLSLLRMVAHAETVLVPWLSLGGALLNSLALNPILRELVILQVATTTSSANPRRDHPCRRQRTRVPRRHRHLRHEHDPEAGPRTEPSP